MGRLKQDTPRFPLAPHYGGRRPKQPTIAVGTRVRLRQTGTDGVVVGEPFAFEHFAPLGLNADAPDGGMYHWAEWLVHVDTGGVVGPYAVAQLDVIDEE